MKPFGLTGNIGCGKSTVASLLRKYPDVLVLDCDHIAKKIILSNEYRQQINTILGSNVFMKEGANFHVIAEIIFKEPTKKRLFEGMIHPLVWAIVDQKIATVGDSKICVVESAIIFETNNVDRFTAIIVAVCNSYEQFRRLRKNRQMDDVQIQARIDQQLSSSEKEHRAQFIIHTDCKLDQLENRVSNLYYDLKKQK